MQTSSEAPVVEQWFRQRIDVEAQVVIRKDKIPAAKECVQKDILVISDEITSSSQCGPGKKSKKAEKTPGKQEKQPKEAKEPKEPLAGTLDTSTPKRKYSKKADLAKAKAAPVVLSPSKIKRILQDLEEVNSVAGDISEKPATVFSPKIANAPVETVNEKNGTSNEFCAGRFKCPDMRCLLGFHEAYELIEHFTETHRLNCKMPYCAYSCFAFQEYSDHFKSVHCLATTLPAKRGPIVSMGNPRKEKKL